GEVLEPALVAIGTASLLEVAIDDSVALGRAGPFTQSLQHRLEERYQPALLARPPQQPRREDLDLVRLDRPPRRPGQETGHLPRRDVRQDVPGDRPQQVLQSILVRVNKGKNGIADEVEGVDAGDQHWPRQPLVLDQTADLGDDAAAVA